MVVSQELDVYTYPSGVSFAFDVLKSNVSGILSFNNVPTYDMDHFPKLPQPILVRVQAPPPYGIPLTQTNWHWDFSSGMLGAVKVEVLQKPSPGKVYGNNQFNVIFWNWPDQTPPAFSAFLVRCNPQLLPDKVMRSAGTLFQGYLRDNEGDLSFLGATSNYLSLIGSISAIDEITPSCHAYCSPQGLREWGSNYITVPAAYREAVQYLDITGFGWYWEDMIGEAAPNLGYWVAFLPINEELSSFFEDVLLPGGYLLPPPPPPEE